jgi:deoxyribodipyrimidine photolyase
LPSGSPGSGAGWSGTVSGCLPVTFVAERLPRYATERNEPTSYVTSELSAHLHFGHVSQVMIALAVRESGAPREDIDAFLEELIVCRELGDQLRRAIPITTDWPVAPTGPARPWPNMPPTAAIARVRALEQGNSVSLGE